MLICHLVTLRPLICLKKRAVWSPCYSVTWWPPVWQLALNSGLFTSLKKLRDPWWHGGPFRNTPFEHFYSIYTVKCGKPLRVGVHWRMLVCQGLRGGLLRQEVMRLHKKAAQEGCTEGCHSPLEQGKRASAIGLQRRASLRPQISRKHPSRDTMFFSQKWLEKRPKWSHHMTSWALETGTSGITWCDDI